MRTGTLTRVTAGEKAGPMRKDSTTCYFHDLPTVGERFSCIGPPINDHSDARLVSTSPIVSVSALDETGLSLKFITESGSLYRLDLDPEAQS